MKKPIIILSAMLFSTVAFSQADQVQNKTFSNEQISNIEKIVHDYFINHPEILIETSDSLQKKQLEQASQKGENGSRKNAADLLRDKSIPVIGNKDGKITLVEFFDYQCSHCRDMYQIIEKLQKSNHELRIVMRDFPIFGENSVYAAKAAIAAQKQDGYLKMHAAIMQSNQPPTKEFVLNLAKKAGLDTLKLEKDINDPETDNVLKANYKLAKELSLSGTPAIVIAKTDLTQASNEIMYFIPGAAPEQELVKDIRSLK